MARGLTKPDFTIVFVIAILLAFVFVIHRTVDSRGEARAKQDKVAITKPAESWTQMSGGQMGVVDIPVTSIKGMTELQTCFVWRDTEYKSASMQCPNDRASYTPDPPP